MFSPPDCRAGRGPEQTCRESARVAEGQSTRRGGTRSGADVRSEAVWKSTRRDRGCVKKRSRERECVWSTWRVTGGARVREVHVFERHERRQRPSRGSTRKGKSRLPFSFPISFYLGYM